MLILTRRVGEVVRIGDQIEMVVLGVKAGQVRVGVSAPAEVPVHRAEIHARIQAQKTASEPSARVITPSEPMRLPGAARSQARQRKTLRKPSAPVRSGEPRSPRLTSKDTVRKG